MSIVNNTLKDKLYELLDLVIDLLLKKVESGEATAQEINCALKLLKDNNITADSKYSDKLKDLGKESTVEYSYEDLGLTADSEYFKLFKKGW